MKKILFLTVLTIAINFSALAGKVYELNLNEGDSFVMVSSIEQKITQSMMGMDVAINLNVYGEMDLVVKEKSENEVLFTQSYKSLKVTMKAPMQGMDVSMDSSGESNQYNDAMRSLIGKEIEVRVDLEGNVLSVEGIDELLAELEAIQASGADLMQFFDEEGLKKNYKAIFPVTYGKDYEAGMTWIEDNNTEGEMAVKLNTTYTAVNVSKKKFLYTSESTSTMSGEQEQQGMEMVINMTGQFSGTGEMDTKTGLLKIYSQSGTMTGNTVIEANEQMPMDMDIPMTIEMTSITTLK